MLRAISVLREGAGEAVRVTDSVTLDHAGRHRRRVVLTGDGGLTFLLDLGKATVLHDGDALVLEDDRLVAVRAAEERLLKVTAHDALALARVAWHIGNRHTPAEITPAAIFIEDDHVLADMVRGLGCGVEAVVRPFRPERGAYDQGGGHHHHDRFAEEEGHAHGHDHHHDHDHDHAGHSHGAGHDHDHHHAHDHDHEHGAACGCGHDHGDHSHAGHDHDTHDHDHHGHAHGSHDHGSHAQASGRVHRHAPDRPHVHTHAHEHSHVEPDGTVVTHAHAHAHAHVHDNKGAHAHDELHGDDAPHNHFHTSRDA